MPDLDLRVAILALLAARATDQTICPSEAARSVGGEGWRDAMPAAHAAARALTEEGLVVLRQRGERVGPDGVVGPYRIGRS